MGRKNYKPDITTEHDALVYIKGVLKRWVRYFSVNYRFKQALEILVADYTKKSEPVKINVYDMIRVKLSDLGDEDRNKAYTFVQLDEDEEGYVTIPLWFFMSIFGDHLDIASDMLISNTDIYLVREDK